MVDAVRFGFLSLVVLALAACGPGDLATPTGTAIDDFDPDFDTGPTVRSAPNVTIAENGKATCTWLGDGDVYAERYIPDVGWVPSQQISDDVGTAASPQAATDQDGDAVVIWEQDGVIVSNDFEVGVGWNEPGPVSNPAIPTAQDGQIAMNDGGDAVIVWQQDGDIHARPFDDTGWLAPVVLDNSPLPTSEPQIAIAPTGDVIVTWENGDGTVAVRRYDASAVAWDPVESLGAGQNPAVDMDDQGNGVVAFDSGGEVLTSEYTADVAWTPPEVVQLPAGTQPGPAHTPHVAVAPTGESMVSFCVGQPEAGEVFVTEMAPGQGFADAVSIAPDVPSCGPPMAALDSSGNAAVLFQDVNSVVQVVPHDSLTNTWEDAIVIGTGRDPSLADNGEGEAVTVFATDYGIGGRVFHDLDVIPAITLGVTVQGGGTVESHPTAIVCTGALCEQAFIEASYVTLTATPMPGQVFSHWVGCPNGDPTVPTCDFFVTQDMAIEAHFVPAP